MRSVAILGWAFALTVSRGGTAVAAPPVERALHLGEVLTSVDASHPKLEQAGRKIEKAEGKALAARGGFDPTLALKGKWSPVGYYNNGQADLSVTQPTPVWGASVYAGYRVGWGDYPSYKGTLETRDYGELRAGVTVPLWRGRAVDERRAKRKRSRIEVDAAELQREADRLELMGKAASAYWKWVAAGQTLTVANELLAIATRRDEALRRQVAAGAVERIKLLDNRRLVLDRRAKVVSARQKLDQAAVKLSLFLRDPEGNTQVVASTRLPSGAAATPRTAEVEDAEVALARALERRPDLARLEADRRAQTVDVRLAKNNRAPKVNALGFVSKDMGPGPETLGPVEMGAGLSLEIPIPLRKARGELRAAKADLAALDAQLRGLRDAIAAEVRGARVGVVGALERWSLARQQVAVAGELADAERKKLSRGASDLVIVNLRETAAAKAATEEIEARADYELALASFAVLTGRAPRTRPRR